MCQIASWKFLFNLSNDCVMYIHIFYCAITKCGELWFRFKLVHDSTSREINDGNVYFSRSTDSFFFSLVDVSSFFFFSFFFLLLFFFSFFLSNFYSSHPSFYPSLTRSRSFQEFTQTHPRCVITRIAQRKRLIFESIITPHLRNLE